MKNIHDIDLKPRKMPRQARSAATVDAIFDATIQVLRKNGGNRLTTTRVAERAGVSVGTLYQYFPHKNALLFAALQRHMAALAVALEDVCERNRGKAIDAIAKELAREYINLKISRAEDRRSFYAVVIDLGMDSTRECISNRMELAVGRLLLSASDAEFNDPNETASTLINAMRAAARAAIERVQDPATLDALRSELTLFARRYLGSFARRPTYPPS